MTQQPKFRTILADPPTNIHQAGALGAARHYDLMSLEDIKRMPVAGLVTDDAHLWLWTTNAALEASFDVVRAWGFTPRSILTWVKPRFQLGVYLRNATEQLIFATRGRAPVRYKSQPTWAFMPLQDHSHKPEEQFAIIERVSPGPYLELFARRRPPSDKDWSVWGNEIDSDITIPGYPVPSDFMKDEEPGEVQL
jgi:N6-adenosine-specific RNA methylase IME4